MKKLVRSKSETNWHNDKESLDTINKNLRRLKNFKLFKDKNHQKPNQNVKIYKISKLKNSLLESKKNS